MDALGGFLLGSFLGSSHTTVVGDNTKEIHERPITPTEVAEHEERLRIIREHSPKVKVALVSSRELTEEDFIGMPMTKENITRHNDWKFSRAHTQQNERAREEIKSSLMNFKQKSHGGKYEN